MIVGGRPSFESSSSETPGRRGWGKVRGSAVNAAPGAGSRPRDPRRPHVLLTETGGAKVGSWGRTGRPCVLSSRVSPAKHVSPEKDAVLNRRSVSLCPTRSYATRRWVSREGQHEIRACRREMCEGWSCDQCFTTCYAGRVDSETVWTTQPVGNAASLGWHRAAEGRCRERAVCFT
jgi:hypothetical protein